MARGKKNCPNCKSEIGARTQLCECGYHYPSDKVRKDLLEEKNKEVSNPSTNRKGVKNCVNCNEEIGVRTHLCKCGWHYPSGKLRPDLLDEKNKKASKIGTGKPGIKNCVNCNEEIGIRTHLCKCGWHYPSGKLRPDLLDEKKIKKNKTYDTEGIGRKRCPGCNLIVAGRLEACFNCDFDFIAAKVEKNNAIEEHKRVKKEKRDQKDKKVNSPQVEKLLQELLASEELISEHLTKKEHAQRILNKGKEKAELLYKYAKKHGCWSHVDWNCVRDELGIQDEKDVEEMVEA